MPVARHALADDAALLRRIDIDGHDIMLPGGELGSFDSLKVLTRCGLRPCAAQMRHTLRWLIRRSWLLPGQCVASPGGSAGAISTAPAAVAVCHQDASRRGARPSIPSVINAPASAKVGEIKKCVRSRIRGSDRFQRKLLVTRREGRDNSP